MEVPLVEVPLVEVPVHWSARRWVPVLAAWPAALLARVLVAGVLVRGVLLPVGLAGRVLLRGLVLRAALVVGLVLAGAPVLLGAPVASAASAPWGWPLSGPHEVSRAFAPPAFRYGVGHRGVDLPAGPGAVVRAAGAGRVSYAGLVAGRSVVVVVHGDLRTTYEPVEPVVALGDVVAGGAPIGRLVAGHAGCDVAACLHWGLRRGDDYLDPVRLVERPPLRLLPVGPPVTSRAGPSGGAGAAPAAGTGRVEGAGAIARAGATAAARVRPVAEAPAQRSPLPPGPGRIGAPAAPPVTVGDDDGPGPGRAARAPELVTAAAALTGSALVAAATGAAVRRRRAAS